MQVYKHSCTTNYIIHAWLLLLALFMFEKADAFYTSSKVN